VTIGKTYDTEVFVLENRWNLEEVDLDKRLLETGNRKSQAANPPAKNDNK
jgi:hypothetical protein